MSLMYVGLDLHLKTSYGTVMRGDGVIVKQGRFPTSEDNLREFLSGIGEARIALEASGFCLP